MDTNRPNDSYHDSMTYTINTLMDHWLSLWLNDSINDLIQTKTQTHEKLTSSLSSFSHNLSIFAFPAQISKFSDVCFGQVQGVIAFCIFFHLWICFLIILFDVNSQADKRKIEVTCLIRLSTVVFFSHTLSNYSLNVTFIVGVK